jgi:tyrosyl-tRNA synthetase
MTQAASPLSLLKDPSLLKTDGLINGQWVAGASRFDVLDPATGHKLADVANLGPADAEAAIAAAEALFGQGDIAALDVATLESALRELPNTTAPATALVTQLLVDTGLVDSVSAARRAIAEGGVSINNVKVEAEDATLAAHVTAANMLVLRRGKKTLAGIFIAG